MDGPMMFLAVLLFALAVHDGLSKIASAIANRQVDVRFNAPIEVLHKKADDGAPT